MIDIVRNAKFLIGQVVKHRLYPFRGVIYDVDPTFSNTEEWWLSIPENVRPRKDQPFYHLLAENAETSYVAYVSEQNLLEDLSGKPVNHPDIDQFFERFEDNHYWIKPSIAQ
ncbi:MAG: heat shock protein HspQ [Gammaproteobacteria bacterium]|jgi:heat shock protein HspQ